MATLKDLLRKMIDKINTIPTKLSELEDDVELGSAVLTTEQELTDEQRAQARANIAEYQWDWRTITTPSMTITDASKKYRSTNSFDIDAAIAQSSIVYSSWCSIGAMCNYSRLILSATTEASILKQIKRVVQDFDALVASGIISEIVYIGVKNSTSDEMERIFAVEQAETTLSSGITYTHRIYFLTDNRTGTVYYNSETEEFYCDLTLANNADETLTISNSAADAKAVGDALALKADKTDIVQPDWNQNDPSAKDYVKNRPFWTSDPVETVVLEETTFDSFEDWDGVYGCEITLTQPIELNQNYTVVFDGVTYELTAFEDDGFPTIGSAYSELADNTDLPFQVYTNIDEGISGLAVRENISHTVSIVDMITQIHQIDSKYIKDMYYTEPDIIECTLEEQTLEFTDLSSENIYSYGGSGYGHTISDFVYADSNICMDYSTLNSESLIYTVIWDGIEYECMASEGDGLEYFCLGNLSLYSTSKTNSGEPFLIIANVFYDSQGLYIFSNDTENKTHTVSFGLTAKGKVRQIQEKYIPTIPFEKYDSGFEIVEVTGTHVGGNSYLCIDASFENYKFWTGRMFMLHNSSNISTSEFGADIVLYDGFGWANLLYEGTTSVKDIPTGYHFCICIREDLILVLD